MGTTLSAGTSDDAASLLFDTRAVFEQWLKLIGVRPSEPEGNEQTDVHVEAEAPSDCDVTFAGVLTVDGPLRGNIRSPHGTLVMTEQGRIEADIDVRIALIDGYFDGNLRASEQVVLERNARVAGNIHTPSLAIKDGAVFEGHSFVLTRTSADVISKVCEDQLTNLTKATTAGA